MIYQIGEEVELLVRITKAQHMPVMAGSVGQLIGFSERVKKWKVYVPKHGEYWVSESQMKHLEN